MANHQLVTSDLPHPRRTGVRCNSHAAHVVCLVYEPRNEAFVVYVNGVHELHPNTGRRLVTHDFNRPMFIAIRRAVAETCIKMAVNGLCEPIWNGKYGLLGHYVTDRDRVLLAIIDRIKELRPKLEVRIRLADTECLNDCCR